jgi:probable addiction module antidote protein/putative addiction module killer protein
LTAWIDGPKDDTVRGVVLARTKRLELGLMGDVSRLGNGVLELRIHLGAGWRIYFTQRGREIIVLLAGGSKRTQKTGIERAKVMAGLLDERGVIVGKGMKVADLPQSDAAHYLDDESSIAAYLTDILEANDAALLAAALGGIARARGMTEIAKAAGITREALYKALRPDSAPRFDTVSRVCAALGVRLVAQPIHPGPKVSRA